MEHRFKMETKLDQVGTLRLAIKALEALPSKELEPTDFVSRGLPGVENGDVRYCPKALVAAFVGGLKGRTRGPWGAMVVETITTHMDYRTIDHLEDVAFDACWRYSQQHDEDDGPARRQFIYKAVLSKAKRELRDMQVGARSRRIS